MREEKRKLRALLDQNFPLPKVILIKDEFGNEQEYEVIEETESALSQTSVSLKPISVNKEPDEMFVQTTEYYEEVIEESEEEETDRR